MWGPADAESEAAVAAALDKAMRTSGRAVLVIAHRCLLYLSWTSADLHACLLHLLGVSSMLGLVR